MTLVPTTTELQRFERLVERARSYAQESLSENTRATYAKGWRAWAEFCEEHGLPSAPITPEAVSLFLTALATKGLNVRTINTYFAAICFTYGLENPPNPTTGRGRGNLLEFPIVKTTIAGIRRTHGKPLRQAAPISIDQLRGICDTLPTRACDRLRALRDKALLLVGYASASRRSELAALNIGDVRVVEEGLWLTIRRSKTDQEGKGMLKAIPYGKDPEYCPVRALLAWMEVVSPVTRPEWPLFCRIDQRGTSVRPAERLTGASVSVKVKAAAERAGIDPRHVSAHSLRAGLLTEAAKAGVPLHKLMAQSGHKTPTVLLSYIRDAEAFRDNAAGKIL